MKNEKLHNDFSKAVDFVNAYVNPLPADLLLKLYAYYKIAKKNQNHPVSAIPLISAFKANALIQAKDVSRTEAMRRYVDLVEKEIKVSGK